MKVTLLLTFLMLVSPDHFRVPAVSQQTSQRSAQLAEAARLSKDVVRLYGEGKYDEALPLA